MMPPQPQKKMLKKVDLRCEFCNKTFISKRDFRLHQYIHKEKVSFYCAYCFKTFPTEFAFKRHSRMHARKKANMMECKICDERFEYTKDLEDHHRKNHLDQKMFHCQQCGVEFSWRENLRKHMRMHSSVNYTCTQCGRGFMDNTSLRLHVRNHHATMETANDKPYVCSVCGKAFKFDFSFEAHMNSHESAGPDCRPKEVLSQSAKGIPYTQAKPNGSAQGAASYRINRSQSASTGSEDKGSREIVVEIVNMPELPESGSASGAEVIADGGAVEDAKAMGDAEEESLGEEGEEGPSEDGSLSGEDEFPKGKSGDDSEADSEAEDPDSVGGRAEPEEEEGGEPEEEEGGEPEEEEGGEPEEEEGGEPEEEEGGEPEEEEGGEPEEEEEAQREDEMAAEREDEEAVKHGNEDAGKREEEGVGGEDEEGADAGKGADDGDEVTRSARGKRRKRITQPLLYDYTMTEEKPFQCEVCEEAFRWEISLKIHMQIHAEGYEPRGPRGGSLRRSSVKERKPPQAPDQAYRIVKRRADSDEEDDLHDNDYYYQEDISAKRRRRTAPAKLVARGHQQATTSSLTFSRAQLTRVGVSPKNVQRVNPPVHDAKGKTVFVQNAAARPQEAPATTRCIQGVVASKQKHGKRSKAKAKSYRLVAACYKLRRKRYMQRKAFPCFLCWLAFPSRAAAQCHRHSHVGREDYTCALCERRLTSHWAMSVHRLEDCPAGRHRCQTCGKGFRQNASCSRHQRLHRATVKPRRPEPAAVPPVANMLVKQQAISIQLSAKHHKLMGTHRLIVCARCRRAFFSAKDFKKHVKQGCR